MRWMAEKGILMRVNTQLRANRGEVFGSALIVLLLFYAPAAVGGAELSPSNSRRGQADRRTAEIISRIQKKYEETRTLKANFEQENHLRSLGRITRSKGRIILYKPGRIRAVYTEPENQLIVSNGKRLWIHTPRLNQVIVSDLGGRGPAPLPLLFLAGKGKLTREFRIELVDEGVSPRKGGAWKAGQPHRLLLKPVRSVAGFQKMWIEADPVSFQISGIEYADELGNTTRIRFSNFNENAAVSPELFEFDIPPGVEVLKTPGQSGPK